ncbi:membrane protein insertase YidC [Tessaracoccus rhinocerotis]|uniref:Membrane protein insertase YidC n=1 Tax=Tessaracoccus rhinocerotis TaxID=1689449 RepID=A0A553JX01_9ACTN|nr:membrane protein insertase YidC [Tessaracoccus rhinocerotis]TRY16964.1 membrane protein insertase YidC [Tessaracoccus rhinocerotis]
MIELLIPLSIWDSIYGAMSTMIQPIYWAVSGLLVLFHWLWSQILDPDSGATWVLSIVTLTVFIRTLLIPLFVKQINSARNMQLVQPKVQALQKKYGSDRQRLGEETMKLYKEEGISPMASCLPLLLQMPIFLSLFRVLQGVADNTIRGQFFKDNPDVVESLQNATLFGAGLSDRIFPLTPFGSTQILGVFLVILMVASLFFTQLQLMRKNMPPEALNGPMAQQQKMMLYLFPVIYAVSSAVIPIGVLIYWLTSNIWTMGQQGILIRNNPAPNTPAFIDWEERMKAKGKDPAAILEERAAKRRRTKSAPTGRVVGGASAASATSATSATSADSPTETDTAGATPKVVRQQVTRQTVRTGEDGKAVVRRQPKAQARSTRKKK